MREIHTWISQIAATTAFVDRPGHYISAHFLNIHHSIKFLYMFYIYYTKNTNI